VERDHFRSEEKNRRGITQESDMGGMKFWRSVSLFGVLPVITLMSVNLALHMQEQHKCGHARKTRPEFVPYEYLRIRNKRFPFGDGTRTLFHNPEINALPGGYEDEM